MKGDHLGLAGVVKAASTGVIIVAIFMCATFFVMGKVGGTPIGQNNPYQWDDGSGITLVFDGASSYSEVGSIDPDDGRSRAVVAPRNRSLGLQSNYYEPWFKGDATVRGERARVFTGIQAYLVASYTTPIMVVFPIILVRLAMWVRRKNREGALDSNFIGLNVNR